MQFEVLAEDKKSKARRGRLRTAHGVVETPAFMPVATKGAVRTLTADEVEALGAKMILANAYHLHLRPGIEVIRQAGGLHRFMGWDGAILTDSGGYQIFSLGKLARISDDGVEFRSVYDGSRHFLRPEDVMAIEEELGADIIMVLDECPPYPVEKENAAAAVRRTIDWSRRCQRAKSRPGQALFGIVQGSVYHDLRRTSAENTIELDFAGYAVGGLSVGEPWEVTYEVLELTTDLLPKDKPRYLMGVGDPAGLLRAITAGVDLFDCAYPTRVARNGLVLTSAGNLNLRNSALKGDNDPLDIGCNCGVCARYSRAYLRHLFKQGEILAHRLLTQHNLYYILNLVGQAREAVEQGTFSELTLTAGGR